MTGKNLNGVNTTASLIKPIIQPRTSEEWSSKLQKFSAAGMLAASDHSQSVTLDALPAAVREKALERKRYVDLVRSTVFDRRMSESDAALFVATTCAEQFPILRTSGKGGASALIYNNYRNWRKRIRAIGDPESAIRALCDDYRLGRQPVRGDSRFWEYLHAFYLNRNRLTLTEAYKLACRKSCAIDSTLVPPTYAQVRYQIEQLDPGVMILAREGEEAYKNKCVEFIRRDWSTIFPGDCIIGDSRTFDTRVRVWDEAKNKWIAVRPNIAGLLDARSWYLASYWITTDPVNSDTLINTLKLYMVQTRGVAPVHVYFDNGKDYCAAGFSNDLMVDGHPHSIFRELGIKLINSIVYNARAKPIERMFQTMMRGFDKLFSDYLGSRPGQRTMSADYYDKHADELPSLEEFCRFFADWLDGYHNTPGNGEILGGKTPAELWHTLNHERALSFERVFMAFFKPEGLRTVSRGSITFNKQLYYCDNVRYGDKVLVKSDLINRDRLLLCRPDGALIGEAKTREAVRAIAIDDHDHQLIGDGIRRQRHELKTTYTMLDDLTGGKHLLAPIELLYSPEDAEVLVMGTSSSVKGPAHSYTHRTVCGVISAAQTPSAPALPAAPEPQLSQEETRELSELNTLLKSPKRLTDDVTDDELSAVHKILSNHNKGDNDEYSY